MLSAVHGRVAGLQGCKVNACLLVGGPSERQCLDDNEQCQRFLLELSGSNKAVLQLWNGPLPSPALSGAMRVLANAMDSECFGFGRWYVYLVGVEDGYWSVPKDKHSPVPEVGRCYCFRQKWLCRCC